VLDSRDDAVFLVQRAKDASLMAGMWELPEVRAWGQQIPQRLPPRRNDKNNGEGKFWFELRHSITVTDYLVRVERKSVADDMAGQWVKKSRIASLPLTGLARKILRKAEMV
jgi:A/G-specific adenine glycosylase